MVKASHHEWIFVRRRSKSYPVTGLKLPGDITMQKRSFADKEVKTLLDGQGLDPDLMIARAFGEKMRREMPLREEAVKASGMQPTTAR